MKQLLIAAAALLVLLVAHGTPDTFSAICAIAIVGCLVAMIIGLLGKLRPRRRRHY